MPRTKSFNAVNLLKGFLLAWFMVLTTLGIVHNAEHGFHKHSHYGQECPIYDFCEHQNLGTGLPAVPAFFAPAQPFPPAVTQLFTLTAVQPVTSAPARAPPSL